MTSRSYVFTINNPREYADENADPVDEPLGISDLVEEGYPIKYAVYQLETGEGGTPHYQGYLQLTSPRRMAYIKQIPGFERSHLEVARGTPADNIRYCTKPDDRVDGPWHVGEPPKGQGNRSDLAIVWGMIKTQEPLMEICESQPSAAIRYLSNIVKLQNIFSGQPRNFKTEVYVLYGPPGAGKSHYASTNFPNAFWMPQGKWFDGYTTQDTIILDDFKRGWLTWTVLMQLMDAYPMKLEVKGGFVEMRAHNLIITSNYHPTEWYNMEKHPKEALIRRIDHFYLFNNFAFEEQILE